VDAHRAAATSPAQARARARNQVLRALSEAAAARAVADPRWDTTVQAVADRDLDPITAAERLLG